MCSPMQDPRDWPPVPRFRVEPPHDVEEREKKLRRELERARFENCVAAVLIFVAIALAIAYAFHAQP
jgi:hypothetical protein